MSFGKTLLAVVGATTLLSTSYRLLSFLYLYIRPSSLSRYLTTSSDGSPPWAFITGASDGIGKAFAADLASRGCNIVLHGRNPSKLSAVKSDLEARYPGRSIRVVVADASNPSLIDFPAIAQSMSDIKLRILVNNAGSTMPRGHEFDTVENYTPAELQANIAVNATFPMLLTSSLMGNLAASQPSLVINVGSVADLGMPLLPSYGASKAFLSVSTGALALEQDFRGRDIEFLYLRIMQVTDTGTIRLPKNVFIPDGPTWVRSALARVGCGQTVMTPYFLHALQVAVLEGMPGFMAAKAKISAMQENLASDPTGAKAEAAAREAAKKEL